MTRCRRASLTAALLLLAVVPAAAQPAPPSPAPAAETPEKRRARALFKEGARLLQLGKYSESLELFRDAYTAFPSTVILINIALAETGLGRPADAANTYQRYLDAADRDPAKVASVEADLATLDQQIGRLRVGLDVTAGAELRLDGGAWFTPSPSGLLRVTPGPHRIAARAATRSTADVPVDVLAGAIASVALQIVPSATPPPVVDDTTTRPPPVDPAEPRDPPPTAVTRTVTPRRPGRLGAQAQVLIEARGQGAAGALGATFAATPRVKLVAGGIVGPSYGGFASATVAITGGRVRPTLTGGVPVMIADGTHIGVRGAAGLEWAISGRASLIADVAAEYYPSPGTFYEPFMVVPSLGLHGRL